MKLNRAFIIVIAVLMGLMILMETTTPASVEFDWDDFSQSHLSKQPFGCYVMDSVLQASLPQGYEVIGRNHDVATDTALLKEKHTYLFTNNFFIFTGSQDVDILKLIDEGNNVLIAIDHDTGVWSEKKRIIEEELFLTLRRFAGDYTLNKENLSDNTLLDTVKWLPGGRFAPATYLINQALCQSGLNLSDSYRTLATIRVNPSYTTGYGKRDYSAKDGPDVYPVAAMRDYGKGKVVVVKMPYIFTNYGFLDDNIRPFALRLLSECGDAPIVRFDDSLYGDEDELLEGEQSSDSPLSSLLANRPLRWAFYLALATLVAFVFFSARRRQRVIPVIKPPKNHMMNFVKQIGGIYYQRHDNVDLLIKKCALFSNTVRLKTMIDLNNFDHIDEEFQALASRTGIPYEELKKQIYDVWSETHLVSISDERLKELIDVMNNILQKINI